MKSGTRIINLLVPLGFRSSCQRMPRWITNFGNGAPAITKTSNSPTITPHFGQSTVMLGGDIGSVASRPGPVGVPDSSAPQPPGALPTGPVELSFSTVRRVTRTIQSPILRAGSSPARFFCASRNDGLRFYRGLAVAAPSIKPGFAATPLCTITVTRSMSSSE